MPSCRTPGCREEAAPGNDKAGRCWHHHIKFLERKRNEMMAKPCLVSGCRQKACMASGETQLCGDHWRDHEARRRVREERDDLIETVSKDETVSEPIKNVLLWLIERTDP